MSDPWRPALSPKQLAAIAACHPGIGKPQYLLFSGPRRSTKTTACLHAVANHLWNVQDASFSIVSPTVTLGDDNGCWTLLTDQVLPRWIDGDFGMEWITEPRQKGVSKKLYCEVTNKFGGRSRVQLDSLQYEDEAEDRFKNKFCSGMYVSELSYYKKKKTFTTWLQTLRGEQFKEWEYLFIGDTNPPDEGKASWIWQEWFDLRVRKEVEEFERAYQRKLGLIEWTMDDNIFESKDALDIIRGMYKDSADMWARYVMGEWVTASGDSIFHEQFRPLIHVIGEIETRTNPDPIVLLPEENCHELITGWDIGQHANDGFVILEKYYQLREVGPENARRQVEVSVFKALDEVVYIGEESTMSQFIQECLEKIEFWEKFLDRKLHWRNWSDRSAFDVRERISNQYHHQLVYTETEGKIILQAADRSPGSVLQRVDLTKKLLFEQRLFFSRARVPNLIDSMQSLPKGKGNVVIKKDSRFKHAFDAASYAWTNECYDEIIRPRSEPSTGRASGTVTVNL